MPGSIGAQKLRPRNSSVAESATGSAMPAQCRALTAPPSNTPSPPGVIPILRNAGLPVPTRDTGHESLAGRPRSWGGPGHRGRFHSAGLVGAQDVHRPQVLDRREAFDDHVLARHVSAPCHEPGRSQCSSREQGGVRSGVIGKASCAWL